MLIDIIKKDGFTWYKPADSPKKSPLEYVEQVNLVNWISYNYPDIVFFATVNERNSNKVDMAKLKRQGLVTGIPDLFLSLGGKHLFVEMKKESGIFSDLRKTQRDVITDLQDQGNDVVICFGFQAAKAAIVEFFKLKRKVK